MNQQQAAVKQLDDIAQLMREREARGLPSYYSVSLEKHGNSVCVISRKMGVSSFQNDITHVIRTHRPQALTIEVYRGYSRKVKDSEANFYIELGEDAFSQTQVQGFAGVFENSQPMSGNYFAGPEQHYLQKPFQLPFNNTSNSEELLKLTEAKNKQHIDLLTQQYAARMDIAIKEIRLEDKDKEIKNLKEEISDRDEYIEKLEKEIKQRPQFGSVGGVNLVEVGSYWLESFVKRNPKLLKAAFNLNDEQLAGIINVPTPTDEQNQPVEQKANASVKVGSSTPKPTYTSEEQRKQFEAADQVCASLKSLPFQNYLQIHGLLYFLQTNPKGAAAIFNYVEKNTPAQNVSGAPTNKPVLKVVQQNAPVTNQAQQKTAQTVKQANPTPQAQAPKTQAPQPVQTNSENYPPEYDAPQDPETQETDDIEQELTDNPEQETAENPFEDDTDFEADG